MAITGTFLANFASFDDAVKQSVANVRTFQDGAANASKQLTTMSNSLSGVGIVQQATIAAEAVSRLGGDAGITGGLLKLTEAELARLGTTASSAVEKLRAMGSDVPPGIQAIADAANRASSSVSGFLEKLDIKKALTDPIGTAKTGLAALAETLGPVGVAAAATVAEVGAVGSELIKLGNDAEKVGAEIGRMGLQFNIPVGAVSDLRFAVKAADGDFDTFGNSMFTFQKRIEDNGDAVGKGLGKIGLSLDSIKALRPDEQFLAISDALRASGDSTNKAAVAFEVFGRQGKDILPLLLKPLSDLTDESERLGATWSETDVNAAREFAAAMTKMGAETEEAWTALGRDVAPATDILVLGWERVKLAVANVAKAPLEGYAAAFHLLTGAMGENALADERVAALTSTTAHLFTAAAAEGGTYADQVQKVASQLLTMGISQKNVAEQTGLSAGAVRGLAGDLKSTADVEQKFADAWDRINTLMSKDVGIENVSAETRGLVADMRAAGASVADMAAATQLSEAQIRLLAKAEEETAAAAKAFATAVGDVNTAGQGWQGTLETIDGDLIDNIVQLNAAGVSMKTIETYYGLTTTQGAALTAMIKDQTEALKIENKAAEENTKLWDEWAAGAIKASGTATDVQIANLKRVSDDMTATRQREGTDDAAYYALRASLDKQASDAILVDHARVAKGSIEALQQEAAKQQATLDDMLGGELHYSRAAIDAQIALRDASVDALHYTAAEHKTMFDHMRDDVDHASFEYRSWLANVATDAEKAALAVDKITDATKKAAAEAQRAYDIEHGFVTGMFDANGKPITSLSQSLVGHVSPVSVSAGNVDALNREISTLTTAIATYRDDGKIHMLGTPDADAAIAAAQQHADQIAQLAYLQQMISLYTSQASKGTTPNPVITAPVPIPLSGGSSGGVQVTMNVSGLLLSSSASGKAEFASFAVDALAQQLRAQGWRQGASK